MPYPESTHPYLNNLDETQTWVQPGAPGQLLVYFDILTSLAGAGDIVYLYDSLNAPVGVAAGYTGVQLAGLAIAVRGDTIKVRLVTDGAGTDWGYRVTNVESVNLVQGSVPGPAVLIDPVHYPLNNSTLAGNNASGPIKRTGAGGVEELWLLAVVPVDWDPEGADAVNRGENGTLCWYLSVDAGLTWAVQDLPGSPWSDVYAIAVDLPRDQCFVATTNLGSTIASFYKFNFVTRTWGAAFTTLNAAVGNKFGGGGFALGLYDGAAESFILAYVYVFAPVSLNFSQYAGGAWGADTSIGAGNYSWIQASTLDGANRFHLFVDVNVLPTLARHVSVAQDGTVGAFQTLYTFDTAPWFNDFFGFGNAVYKSDTDEVLVSVILSPGGAPGVFPPGEGAAYQAYVYRGVAAASPAFAGDRIFKFYADGNYCVPDWSYYLYIAVSHTQDYSTVHVFLSGLWKTLRNHAISQPLTEANFNPPYWDTNQWGVPQGNTNRTYVYETHNDGSGWSNPLLVYDFNVPPTPIFPAAQSDWHVFWQTPSMSVTKYAADNFGVYTSVGMTMPDLVPPAPPYNYANRMGWAIGYYVGMAPAVPPVPPAPPAPVSIRSFAIGKPYIKCGNVWDWCLKNSECPWYLVPWGEHGCIPVKCWRLEDDPLHSIPEQGRELHKWGSIPLPAIPSVDTQILQFRVPLGFDGIIYSVLCKFMGTGYANGDGNLIWRFRQNDRWIKSLHSIPTELGDFTSYMQLEEYIRIYSGQTVRAYGWLNAGSGLVGGSMIAALQGWYFPSQFAR